MKTFPPNHMNAQWFVVDAHRQGPRPPRFLKLPAVCAASTKTIYTPTSTPATSVVVTNVEKLVVTGNKADDKKYYRHSGYPGGVTETNFRRCSSASGPRPGNCCQGMLPKGPLGYAMLKKLKCYAGSSHPHSAQQPKAPGNLRVFEMAEAYFYGYGRRRKVRWPVCS